LPIVTTDPADAQVSGTAQGHSRRDLALLLLAGLAINLLLIATPGFYSHDELDWRNRIARDDYGWSFGLGDFDHSPFYRALGAGIISASLRLPLQPFSAHLVEATLAIATACLLYGAMRLFRPDRAFAAAALFMLTPGFAYSVGWIAAGFDVQYTLFGAACVYCAIRHWRGGGAVWAVLSLTAWICALGCKETALALPLVGALVAYIDRDRIVVARAGVVAGAMVAIVAVYFGLRGAALLHLGQTGGGGYRFGGFGQAAINAAAYFGFPFTFGMVEIGSSPIGSVPRIVERLGPHIVLLALIVWQAGPRWALIYLAGYGAPLLPVLPISKFETQYTYATSIPLAIALSLLWRRAAWASAPVAALTAILVWRALAVQVSMYETGACQTRALETLGAVLSDLPAATPTSVLLPDDTPWPVLSRSLFDNSFLARGQRIVVTPTRRTNEAGMIFHPDCRVSRLGGG